ncbi:MAG TPA: hypothetical protein VFA45_19660 [Actinomycetes bacterium]|jgi:hypothetical protein|nr:hypothetical protein [Actinomycetes bacterium]
MRNHWRVASTVVAVAALAGALLLTADGAASADYGPGASYQIELSANVGGPQGGGFWLWIALYPDGTGDYAGSDCGHGLGAVPDQGDVTWSSADDSVVINGVVLNGLDGFRTTITVPRDDGHYAGTVGSFLTLPDFIPPDVGTSQLQVAP